MNVDTDETTPEPGQRNATDIVVHNGGLCPQCRQMFASDRTIQKQGWERDAVTNEFVPMDKSYPGGPHHTSPYNCQAASRAGCPICMLVWQHIVGDKDSLAGQPGKFTTFVAQEGSEEDSQTKYPKDIWILQIDFKSLMPRKGILQLLSAKEYSMSFALLPQKGMIAIVE
jgi:hypothetical protein